MDVYDPSDKKSIFVGLNRVFGFDDGLINQKIADQVHFCQQIRCELCELTQASQVKDAELLVNAELLPPAKPIAHQVHLCQQVRCGLISAET